MATRVKMRKTIVSTEYEYPVDFTVIEESMKEDLTKAMYASYKSSVDYEGDTMEDFREDIELIFRGLYGKFIQEASNVIREEGEIASGLFVCDFKGEPTVTYHFTVEEHQNKAYAKLLLHKAEEVLHAMGYEHMYLYLNLDNINAYNLYDSMGFDEVPIKSDVEIIEEEDYEDY